MTWLRSCTSRFSLQLAILTAVAAMGVAMVFALVAFAPLRNTSLGEQIGNRLKVIPSLHETTYLFNPTKGKYKDMAAPAQTEVFDSPKRLKKVGVTAWEWLKNECDTYSTTGDADKVFDDQIVVACTNTRVTKAEVLKWLESQLPSNMKA